MSPISVTRPAVGRHASPSRHRDEWAAHLARNPVEGLPQDEVQAHIQYMPAHYWTQVAEADLVWELQLIHQFMTRSLLEPSDVPGVVVAWRHLPERGVTKVVVCEWDRHGLLAQIAAAFSALQLNVCRADAYTRSDNIALDMFEVCESQTDAVASDDKLRDLAKFIDSGLREPLGYIISRLSEPSLESGLSVSDEPPSSRIPTPRIHFCNSSDTDVTVLHLEATDRLGLLYDVLQALSDLKLAISGAVIETTQESVNDAISISEEDGSKIQDIFRLKQIQQSVMDAVQERKWAAD